MGQPLFVKSLISGSILVLASCLQPAFAEQSTVSGQLSVAEDAQGSTALSGSQPILQSSPELVNSPISQSVNPVTLPMLKVVKTEDEEWTKVADTLRGINYRELPLKDLNSQTLSATKILLLPNVQTLSSEQVQALIKWVKQGGKLIATGAIGAKSSPEVQASLRSLLGGYWQGAVGTATNILVRSDLDYSWVQSIPEVTTTVVNNGGYLTPSASSSRAVAFWRNNVPAVLADNSVIFLGWQWGTAKEREAFDRSWLIAAVQRPTREMPVATTPATTESPSLQKLAISNPRNNPTNNSTSNSTNNQLSVPSNTRDSIFQRIGISNPTSNSTSNPTSNPTSNQPRSSSRSNLEFDDQVITPEAPPVSNLQINYFEQLTLNRELQELAGRVENALNSFEVSQNTSESFSAKTATQRETLALTEQFLKGMPQMIANRQYAQVRATWQQLRQELWRDYPTNLLVSVPEVRAIWLDRGTIVAAGSEQGLVRVFDRMAKAGVNTIFIETVNAGYTIYPSSVAPQQNPLTRGWDPLAAAVKLAHERKMELHAWVWVYGVGNRRHNPLVNQPTNYVGPVLSAYPSWGNLRQDGAIFAPEGKTFIDPANPEVQNYLLSLYREIVTRYNVDGLQLDYIRYPRQDNGYDFGFGSAGRQKFMALTGIDPINISQYDRSLWWMWTEFRTQQVNEFVHRVSKDLKQLRPNLMLSAAVFSWKPIERITRMQQNWETWVARGDLDLLVPMTYAQNTERFLQEKVQPVLSGVAKSPVLLLPGLFIKDVSDIELLDKLQAVRDLPSGGYSLFATEHLRPSFQALLNSTKPNQEANILPYRHPFAAALSRYTSLQQEWQILLKNNRLWVRGENLTSLEKQSKALEQALSELTQKPTHRNFKNAMSALETVTTNLPGWMRLENISRPYRVTAWTNRLAAIAAFLRYGDRTQFNNQQPTAAATERSVAIEK